jgi:hypothetical protein
LRGDGVGRYLSRELAVSQYLHFEFNTLVV